jgi:hypothetical protein
MNKIHLSADQKALCKLFSEHDHRPTIKEYESFCKRMKELDKSRKKPKRKGIPNTMPGYEPKEVKLTASFDAFKDLPEGWGVYSMHDSGGNHKIFSAGDIALTFLWNTWTPGKLVDPTSKTMALLKD